MRRVFVRELETDRLRTLRKIGPYQIVLVAAYSPLPPAVVYPKAMIASAIPFGKDQR
jgi:hypothetical protein